MKKSILLLLLLFATRFCCLGQSSEIDRIKASLSQITDSLHYVDALNRMAMLLYEKNADSTFFYTVKAREIADRLNYHKGKADAVNNLGVFFDIKGNLQLALRYYNDAQIGYTNLKDSANQVQAMMNIAMVYKELERNDRAIAHYDAAIELGKKLRKDSIMSLTIYNYLLQFPLRFNTTERKALIAKAKQIASTYKDTRTLLAIEQLIADDMIANGQRQEGLALLAETIEATISNHLYYVSMDMIIDIGDHLLATDTASAIAYYKKGLAIANKNGYLIYSKLLSKKLFDYYSTQNNHVLANKYGREMVSATEKQEELTNSSGVDYLDYAIKEQQVETLVAKASHQKTLLILAVLACMFALAFTLFIKQNLKRSKKLNKLIAEQNNMMKQTLVALEQSQADNTKMMKIAAHDLRNPIGGIYSLASLMLEDSDRPATDKEMLTAIKQSGENSLALVKDLLEVQFNTADFNKEEVDIEEILRYCVTLLQNTATLKQQKIQLHSFTYKIAGSREKLWRVFSNLIANAIKFSATGALIKVSMAIENNKVLISVKDEGIGIDPAMQDKIFEPFTEVKRQGTIGEKAYGLGLFISKQLIEAHGGQIWLESLPGQGSTFFVALPISQGDD